MANKPRKKKTIEHLDASIGRWKTRLKRAITMIDKLEKQRKRIEKAAAKPIQPDWKAAAETAKAASEKVIADARVEPADLQKVYRADDDTGIPAFLQRKPLDPVAAEIKAEQEQKKLPKARGRIATMKAKKSGATKAMPLTGNAALDAIRNGT